MHHLPELSQSPAWNPKSLISGDLNTRHGVTAPAEMACCVSADAGQRGWSVGGLSAVGHTWPCAAWCVGGCSEDIQAGL